MAAIEQSSRLDWSIMKEWLISHKSTADEAIKALLP